MKLTTAEKQGILLGSLLEGEFKHSQGYAIFGIGKDVVKPLINKGWIHSDTYKFTGGATLTEAGRTLLKKKLEEQL